MLKLKTYFFPLLIIIFLSTCSKEDEITISYIEDQSEKTWKRFDKWAAKDETVIFPIITDLHSGGNDNYKHITYLNETNNYFNYDFISNLGDIGLDVEATYTTESANQLLLEISSRHEEYLGITLFCKGNHDRNGGNNTLLENELLALYLQKTNKIQATQKFYREPNKNYGYLDIVDKKTRIFFTDSSDIDYYGYSEGQLRYIIDNLNNLPEDYTVVILTHRCPDKIGRWYYNGKPDMNPVKTTNNNTLIKLLLDFTSRSAGKSHSNDNISLSWDFTNATGKLVGILCGDSHFDAEIKSNNINFIVTQGYGSISKLERPPHAIVTSFNPQKEMLIDIVAIKPHLRQMKYFRLGAGGSARDRSFTY